MRGLLVRRAGFEARIGLRHAQVASRLLLLASDNHPLEAVGRLHRHRLLFEAVDQSAQSLESIAEVV